MTIGRYILAEILSTFIIADHRLAAGGITLWIAQLQSISRSWWSRLP